MQRFYGRFSLSSPYTFNLLHNFPHFHRYSSSSSSSSPSTTDFTQYLVNSLGFTQQEAITTSTRFSQYKVNYSIVPTNAFSVVNLFKDYDFSDADIRKIVYVCPRLLTYRADTTIRPKLGFLIDQGFSRIDLIRVVTKSPSILTHRVESGLLPVLQVLRKFFDNDAHVIAFVKKLNCRYVISVINNLLLNVEMLTSYGVPIELVRKHGLHQPSTLLRDPNTLKDTVINVEKKLGITRESTMFLYGVYLFSEYSEDNIESKCRAFKSFGWTQSDVEMLMVKNICCFTLSEQNITNKLGFLMNKLGLTPAYLASSNCLLTCSLEKRILPRHNVLHILEAKGLLKTSLTLRYVVAMSESRFVNMFVTPFEEVRHVYAKHTSSTVESLTQEKAEYDLTVLNW